MLWEISADKTLLETELGRGWAVLVLRMEFNLVDGRGDLGDLENSLRLEDVEVGQSCRGDSVHRCDIHR